MADTILQVLNTMWTNEDGEKLTCWQMLKDGLVALENSPTFSRIEADEETVAQLRDLIDSIKEDVDDWESKMVDYTTRIGAIGAAILLIQAAIDAASTDISGLLARQDTVETDTSNIEKALAGDSTSPLY